MNLYKATIKPITAFSSPIQGDTLFGYMCWEYLNGFGEDALNDLLNDYAIKPPFVVSDAFPTGFLPKPNVPISLIADEEKIDNLKNLKKLKYIDLEILKQPFNKWGEQFKIGNAGTTFTRTHNAINRETASTTGTGFDPYIKELIHYGEQKLDIYLCIDSDKIGIDTVKQLLSIIGNVGYGAGKTRGSGKFDIEEFTENSFDVHNDSNCYLTLAPHYPEQNTYDSKNSYYKTTTKFGKHGDVAVLSGYPYKSPVLLCGAGAVMTPNKMDKNKKYIGIGLGGGDKLSATINGTVHQGYAPVIPIYNPAIKGEP